MKYVKKMPSTNTALSKDLLNNGWTKIKEPSTIAMATLYSMPLAFLLGGIVLFITFFLHPSIFDLLQSDTFAFTITLNLSMVLFLLAILGFLTLHELIHALFIPHFMSSNKTFWGINCLFGFVFSTEPIKKSRFLIISMMPCVILSFLLPFVLNFFGLLNGYTMFLCLFNAMGSCVDLLNIILIAFQVPKGCIIINNGFETFYK